MTYEEYKNQRQSEFNALPIFFAFSMEQFAREMEKRELTVDDTDKIYRFGNGGFYLRSDAPIIREFMNKPDPIRELMNDPEFAESAFYYEMGNHEYHINLYQGDWDVCSCFGSCDYGEEKDYRDYLKEMGYSPEVISAFRTARNHFYEDCVNGDRW